MTLHEQNQSDRSNGAAPLLITAKQLAEMMQISIRTLWRLRSAGQLIEPVKVGGATRWRRDEVHEWIAKGCPIQSTHEK